jgi:hypothetical protein
VRRPERPPGNRVLIRTLFIGAPNPLQHLVLQDTLDRHRQNASLHLQETLVPYPNDRRKSPRDGDDALSPEYLAMLVVCGGEVRASDRAALPEVVIERRIAGRADDAESPSRPLPKIG